LTAGPLPAAPSSTPLQQTCPASPVSTRCTKLDPLCEARPAVPSSTHAPLHQLGLAVPSSTRYDDRPAERHQFHSRGKDVNPAASAIYLLRRVTISLSLSRCSPCTSNSYSSYFPFTVTAPRPSSTFPSPLASPRRSTTDRRLPESHRDPSPHQEAGATARPSPEAEESVIGWND
jgi:hypothetical protein